MNTFHDQAKHLLLTLDRIDKGNGCKDTEIGAALPWSFSHTLDLIKDLVESGDLYPVMPRVYKNISPWSGA